MKFLKFTNRVARAGATGLLGAAVVAGAGTWASPASASPVMASPVRTEAAGLPTKAVPGLKNCGLGKTEVKPRALVLSCADAGSLAEDISWSKWSSTGASATGTFSWHICVPYCAASKKWGRSAANYTLGKLVHTAKYGWLFEELTLHITGKQTGGFPRVVHYSQKPV